MRFRTVWLSALLPIAAVIELAAGVRQRSAAPREADYDAIIPVVSQLHREGDLVVVAPRWAEPHVRRALGDDFFPLAAVARSDTARFPRAIEISLLGEEASELSGFREVDRRDAGGMRVRVLENGAPEPVVFDFVEHLEPRWASAFGTDPAVGCSWSDRARVASGGLGGTPTFPAKRFVCQDDFYLNVSATIIADERFLPRRCIYAHPTPAGARVVRFDKVPLGQRIVGHSGLYWMIERSKLGAPVDLEVRVDGDSLGTFTHSDGEGWKRFEVDLGPHANSQEASVEFVVSAARYEHRHFCFQADSR
jgi:hypothetical protein